MCILNDGGVHSAGIVEGDRRRRRRRRFDSLDNSGCFVVSAHGAATAARASAGAAMRDFAANYARWDGVLFFDFGANFNHAHFDRCFGRVV